MKKALLFSLALIAVGIISSCNKDRVCECEIKTTGFIPISFTVDTTFTNVSKGDAESKCNDLNSFEEDVDFGITVESICELE